MIDLQNQAWPWGGFYQIGGIGALREGCRVLKRGVWWRATKAVVKCLVCAYLVCCTGISRVTHRMTQAVLAIWDCHRDMGKRLRNWHGDIRSCMKDNQTVAGIAGCREELRYEVQEAASDASELYSIKIRSTSFVARDICTSDLE